MPLTPSRFEKHPPMLMAGLRRTHVFVDASKHLPQQWQEFVNTWPVPNRANNLTFGVMCASDMAEQTFEYMCAVEVSTFDGLPQTIGRIRIPAAEYAVFTHLGPAASIHQTWDEIWKEWVPNCGLRPGQTPDFERYDERFDPVTASGVVEICFPVTR